MGGAESKSIIKEELIMKEIGYLDDNGNFVNVPTGILINVLMKPETITSDGYGITCKVITHGQTGGIPVSYDSALFAQLGGMFFKLAEDCKVDYKKFCEEAGIEIREVKQSKEVTKSLDEELSNILKSVADKNRGKFNDQQ